MLRKVLFSFLLLTFLCVPVFQAAHALTHLIDADAEGAISVDGNQEQVSVHVVGAPEAGIDLIDADSDRDRICLDCLALTGFNVVLSILAIIFSDRKKHQPLYYLQFRFIPQHFPSLYRPRGPPAQA